MSDSNPNVVGINVLKQNGLDVDELVKELITNAAVSYTHLTLPTILLV